ncbi:MAG: urease accessory protein UreD [Proteobacteria bacterium]|nr:urease accessory protein UreD [Pseudomonadota bacterium]MBI3497446.1 urease accessory protein UreD [Pseudomonadota bacterium]
MFAATLPSEVPEDAPRIRPAAPLQRGDGAAHIRVRRRGRQTVLAELYQRSPARVLFPNRAADEPLEAVLVTTSGGLAGGDRLQLRFAAAEGAKAIVTTQAAEKIYRSLGDDCRISVNLEVAAGAELEWLPQETILFDGARLDRRNEAEIAPEGRFFAAEMVVFGRLARGESFSRGFWHERWRLWRGGRLVWADALSLEDDIAETIGAPSGFAGAEASATAFYLGAGAERLLSAARAIVERAECRAGVTRLGDLLVARWLGSAGRVRDDLQTFLVQFRTAACLPGRLPRVWYS